MKNFKEGDKIVFFKNRYDSIASSKGLVINEIYTFDSHNDYSGVLYIKEIKGGFYIDMFRKASKQRPLP